MRSRIVIAAVAMLVASAAFAQQRNEISVFATSFGFGSSRGSGSEWTGGGGLSLNHFWSPQFSTEFSVGAEHRYATAGFFDSTRQAFVTYRESATTVPFDLVAQFHARTDSRWKPYIGGGFRYVHRPAGTFNGSVFAPELNTGVVFRMTPALGLKLDAKVSTASDVSWNPSFKPSIGLSWRF